MIVAAAFLGAIGHLDAAYPERPKANDAVYKAIVLREITRRIQYKNYEDETVASLLKLASYEVRL